MSRSIYAPSSSSMEIYQGCRTPSERSVFSASSSEPSLSPSPSAREIYEGLMTPDWWQLSQSSGHSEGAVADASEPFAARTFTIRELAAATNNFSLTDDCLLGQGEFGQVYKGRLKTTNQVVAIKRFNNGSEGCRVFHIEVMMQSLLHHPNIVEFIGYCAEGNQKLVVHEYMPLGSLEDHLHFLSSHRKPLDWNTRMNIAVGVAKGLEFLHDKANPPVIFGGLKSSNILLEKDYHPKLSGLGTATLQPVGDNSTVSTTDVGTYGYLSPEHAMPGELSLKSDIYNFGVVLLEIITSRKAFDNSKNVVATSLLTRARSLFKDQTRLELMADPMLQGQYPKRSLRRALAIAAACLEEQPAVRPPIARVVAALCYLASQPYVPKG